MNIIIPVITAIVFFSIGVVVGFAQHPTPDQQEITYIMEQLLSCQK